MCAEHSAAFQGQRKSSYSAAHVWQLNRSLKMLIFISSFYLNVCEVFFFFQARTPWSCAAVCVRHRKVTLRASAVKSPNETINQTDRPRETPVKTPSPRRLPDGVWSIQKISKIALLANSLQELIWSYFLSPDWRSSHLVMRLNTRFAADECSLQMAGGL